jgi:peptidoglycan hydrolase-like protein with peptidoglycan-binding domain
VRRQKQRKDALVLRGAGIITRHPREFVGMTIAVAAVATIFINALFLQKGPHPAPIFAPKVVARVDAPVAPHVVSTQPAAAPQSRTQLITDIQRELNRRGFYDGLLDGVWGAKTDAAAREFAQAAGLTVNVEASDNLLRAIVASRVKAKTAADPKRPDPIAALIAPSGRILAVQAALADFGYGQLKPTGVFDADTRDAIEKFERDRRLPVTGDVSDAVVRELAAMTGRPLE